MLQRFRGAGAGGVGRSAGVEVGRRGAEVQRCRCRGAGAGGVERSAGAGAGAGAEQVQRWR